MNVLFRSPELLWQYWPWGTGAYRSVGCLTHIRWIPFEANPLSLAAHCIGFHRSNKGSCVFSCTFLNSNFFFCFGDKEEVDAFAGCYLPWVGFASHSLREARDLFSCNNCLLVHYEIKIYANCSCRTLVACRNSHILVLSIIIRSNLVFIGGACGQSLWSFPPFCPSPMRRVEWVGQSVGSPSCSFSVSNSSSDGDCILFLQKMMM